MLWKARHLIWYWKGFYVHPARFRRRVNSVSWSVQKVNKVHGSTRTWHRSSGIIGLVSAMLNQHRQKWASVSLLDRPAKWSCGAPHEDSPFRSIRGADWVHWGMFALTRRLVAIWFRWRVSQLNQFLVFYSDFLIYLPGFLAGFLSKWKWFGFQSLEPSLNAILFTWLKANRRHTIFFWNWPGNKIKQLACRFQAHY